MTPIRRTEGERIAALETMVSLMAVEQAETNKKLDELLVLRHKGVGAFWLASALTGTGILGSLGIFFEFFKTSG